MVYIYHELTFDILVCNCFAILLQKKKRSFFSFLRLKWKLENQGFNAKLTHFMRRMLPGEYCTNSTFILNPHCTHLCSIFSLALSSSAKMLYCFFFFIERGLGDGPRMTSTWTYVAQFQSIVRPSSHGDLNIH